MRGIELKRAVQQKPRGEDSFTVKLLRLILGAKEAECGRLAEGHPVEVAACRIYQDEERRPHLNEKRTHVDYEGIVRMAEEAEEAK